MNDKKLTFDIFARDRTASKTFNSVGRSADKTGRSVGKLGKGMLKFGKVAALGLAGGVLAAGFALKGFIADAEESRKISRLTAQVIKTTGGVANVTAKQVDKLATSISNKTGVDDEAIQSGANLLLTFKNIHNEVGRGNKIFDRATQAAVDLSAAGFGDLTGTSKQLGKALNDPIKGISALGRAGVTFTEKQKKTIKHLVETNRILEAQKIILKEVESQVGGAAAAQATPWEKLKVTLGNLGEEIGLKLLPTIDKLATWAAKTLPGAMDKTGKWLSKNKEKLEAFGLTITIMALAASEGILGLAQVFLKLEKVIIATSQRSLGVFTAWFGGILDKAADLAEKFKLPMAGALRGASNDLKNFGKTAGEKLGLSSKAADAASKSLERTRAKVHALRMEVEDLRDKKLEVIANNAEIDANRARIKDLKARIDKLKNKKVITQVDERQIRRSLDEVASLRARIAALQSKSVTVKVYGAGEARAAVDALNSALRRTSGAHVSIGGVGSGISERASGGPIVKGRTYLTGEKGPELITAGSNGYVHNAAATARMGGSPAAPVVINATYNINGSGLDEASLKRILNAHDRDLGRKADLVARSGR